MTNPSDPLLHGAGAETNVVKVERLGESHVRVFRRHGRAVGMKQEDVVPFLLLREAEDERFVVEPHRIVPLAGPNPFSTLVAFESFDHRARAEKRLRSRRGRPVISFPNPVTEHLLRTGNTLFKGMTFECVRRLTFDIETDTAPGYDFPNARRKEDRVILITVADPDGGTRVLGGPDASEEEILRAFLKEVADADPDVIEGHNILHFDIPYLEERFRRHDIPFSIGRYGGAPTWTETTAHYGDREVRFRRYEIPGRDLADTYVLLQAYDAPRRELSSLSLKNAAKHFGFAATDRTYVEGRRIGEIFRSDPETVMRYALDDVIEARTLAEMLLPTYVYLAQMLPLALGDAISQGTASKIELLLVREYLRMKRALPAPAAAEGEADEDLPGGYTECFGQGLVRNVVAVDVESLYPSLMLREKIAPRTDELGAFLGVLRSLTTRRLEAKARAFQTTDPTTRARAEVEQSTLKILINSFYGYLAFPPAIFSDFEAARRVTESGQEIIKSIIAAVERRGGKVVEVDTDGLYFVPPQEAAPEAVQALLSEVRSEIPKELKLRETGRFRAMYSYLPKNYALLPEEGGLVVRGSALRSSGLEPLFREFVRQALTLVFEEDPEGLRALYLETRRKILTGAIDIKELSREEMLKQSPDDYAERVKAGKRPRSAAYEVAIRAGQRFRRGDRVSYYVAGRDLPPGDVLPAKLASEFDPAAPDVNALHYEKRLKEVSERFRPLFSPEDFDAVFGEESLFDRKLGSVRIVTWP